ncbi:MAG: hypothetical protein IJS28_00435 [Synergistaceae bacterium]|nr:hypothetical protein [Synergistaceae bacterium]
MRNTSSLLQQNDIREINSRFRLHDYPSRNRLLSDVMISLRRQRRLIPHDYVYSLTYIGDIVQLWLQSPPCRFSEAGSCTMCNYWKGRRIPDIAGKVTASAKIEGNPHSILINTCGSVLDDYELAAAEREQLFSWVNELDIPEVILETHISTLTQDCIDMTAEIFSGKTVYFEAGIESVSNDVLFYCLNKPRINYDYSGILAAIHRHKNLKAIANVILGAPFLTREEQEADALNSIIFLLDNGFDYAVLFPVNIKPLTLPELLMKHGLYSRIQGDSLINVLSSLPDEMLPLVNTAWFGNRSEDGVIPPEYDEDTREEKLRLLEMYNVSPSVSERRRIINRLLCLTNETATDSSEAFRTRLEHAYSLIEDNML